jgi:predicted acetyltransferase
MYHEELRLEEPNIKHQQEHETMLQEFLNNNEPIIPRAMRIKPHESYQDFLQRTADRKEEKNIPEQRVPASLYFIINKNNKIIWCINIRHILNEWLEKLWWHIGYGIRPSERKKWYGTTALKLALEKCVELWIQQPILICDKENVWSVRVIENNGWILESEYPCKENDNIMTQKRIIHI